MIDDRLLLTGRVLAAILWWWRTGPEAVLKVTQRTGACELGIADIAGSTILSKLAVDPLVHYGGN